MRDMYIMNCSNKLDIGAADMDIIRDNVTDRSQLIVCFKTIHINVYTVNVIDLEDGSIIYIHESFCLWETEISSFMNKAT